MPAFAYSFDRESFVGSYPSRRAALEAAYAAAGQMADAPLSAFVAQRVEPNPRAFGNARVVIDQMRRRVRDEIGDAAEGYLARLNDAVVTDLDSAMEKVVLDWLDRHALRPKVDRYEAVGEYALAGVAAAK